MTKVRSSWTSTCRGGRSPKDGRCPPAPTTYPRTRSAGRQIRIPIYKITSSPKLQPSAGAYRAFGRFYPRLQPFRSHSGASGFWAFAVIIECVSFSPEFAISPIELMVSRKCSSAEREFLAIACGQTLELKKMAATSSRVWPHRRIAIWSHERLWARQCLRCERSNLHQQGQKAQHDRARSRHASGSRPFL